MHIRFWRNGWAGLARLADAGMSQSIVVSRPFSGRRGWRRVPRRSRRASRARSRSVSAKPLAVSHPGQPECRRHLRVSVTASEPDAAECHRGSNDRVAHGDGRGQGRSGSFLRFRRTPRSLGCLSLRRRRRRCRVPRGRSPKTPRRVRGIGTYGRNRAWTGTTVIVEASPDALKTSRSLQRLSAIPSESIETRTRLRDPR